MEYEYKPVPVEQLADYMQHAVDHEATFLPVTFFRNVVRELYDIKTRKAPATEDLLLLGYMFVTASGCVTYSISDIPVEGWTLVGPIYGPRLPRLGKPS